MRISSNFFLFGFFGSLGRYSTFLASLSLLFDAPGRAPALPFHPLGSGFALAFGADIFLFFGGF